MTDADRDPAQLARALAARGVVGVAVSYVDNGGIARVKAVPLARLEHAVSRGNRDVAGVRCVHVRRRDHRRARPRPDRSATCGCSRTSSRWWCSPPSPAGRGRRSTAARRMGDAASRAASARSRGGWRERAAERGLERRMGFESEWVLDAGSGRGARPGDRGAGVRDGPADRGLRLLP